MTDQAISVRRDGAHVVIEDIEATKDYRGVLKAIVMDADAAIRFGDAVAALGRLIKRENRIVAAGKHLALGTPYDLYAEKQP